MTESKKCPQENWAIPTLATVQQEKYFGLTQMNEENLEDEK